MPIGYQERTSPVGRIPGARTSFGLQDLVKRERPRGDESEVAVLETALGLEGDGRRDDPRQRYLS
jgi:hypothetical protein